YSSILAKPGVPIALRPISKLNSAKRWVIVFCDYPSTRPARRRGISGPTRPFWWEFSFSCSVGKSLECFAIRTKDHLTRLIKHRLNPQQPKIIAGHQSCGCSVEDFR